MAIDLIDRRLFNAFEHGIPVVTAQRTQSRILRYTYARSQMDAQVGAWPSPQLFVWSEWVFKLAEEIMWSGHMPQGGQRKLLSNGQEQLIWEQIVRQYSDKVSIENLSGTAARAREAWMLVQTWRLPDPKTAQFPSHDVRQFSNWMRHYYERMTEQKWLDHARLVDTVAPAINAGAISAPSDVLLYGFPSFTPQQRVLLKNLEQAGTRFVAVKPRRRKAEIKRISFSDHRTELEAAARWARQSLSRSPPGIVAIAIPDLEKQLSRVRQVFDDVLSPGSSLPGSSLVGRPYSVSVDTPYASYKLVESALLILRCALLDVSFSQISSFLRCPFVRGATAEQPYRARFELWLRHHNIDYVQSGQLLLLLERFDQRRESNAAHSVLGSILSALKPLLINIGTVHSMQHWASLCNDILEAMGWPGDGKSNVIEQQVVTHFRDILNSLSELDLIVPECDATKALENLVRMVRNTRFRPNLSETTVQIMKPEEAFALRFNGLWVSGLHSQNWPKAPTTNPFLPIEWQCQYQLPGCTGALQLEAALDLTEDICGGGDEVVFSYPQTNNEEELSESPIVSKVPAKLYEDYEFDHATDYCEMIRAATDLVQLSDSKGPELSSGYLQAGGASVFQLQSQCQFKAFAQMRLGAKPWTVPRAGVGARDKGIHLHKALEFLWSKMTDLSTLKELAASEHLENQVYREVDLALDYQDRKRVRRLAEPVRQLEQHRLVQQIMDILALEQERSDFEVLGQEVMHKLDVGPIKIEARIDRVDHVPGHGIVLVDYKLGERKPNAWKMPRMLEPQLPLYTLAYGETVAGIGFINGKKGAVSIVGVSRSKGIANHVKTLDKSVLKEPDVSWEEQLKAWKDELITLANDFASGQASVNPKNKYTCQTCDLQSFCRVKLGDFNVTQKEALDSA